MRDMLTLRFHEEELEALHGNGYSALPSDKGSQQENATVAWQSVHRDGKSLNVPGGYRISSNRCPIGDHGTTTTE